MCQQWLSVVGQILDVIGFLTIAWEWHHMYKRDHDKRISELQTAYERNRAEQEGRRYEDFDEDASMWREFQKLFLAEWKWRAKVFFTGVTLVVLGFLGQLLGSWPYGVPFLGFKSC
jgi:hypothetical protein